MIYFMDFYFKPENDEFFLCFGCVRQGKTFILKNKY